MYVGDRHQAIYGFRGASNAMELIPSDETFYLTGSFRFGNEVAEVANRILDLKGDVVHLRGLGRKARSVLWLPARAMRTSAEAMLRCSTGP